MINYLQIRPIFRTHSQLSQAVSELARTSYRYVKVSKFPDSNADAILIQILSDEIYVRWQSWDRETNCVSTLQ